MKCEWNDYKTDEELLEMLELGNLTIFQDLDRVSLILTKELEALKEGE